jgi:sigma-B regulation protein RsbU (phosphoserine phosphatase)
MGIRDTYLIRRALEPVAACWLRETSGFGVWQDDHALVYWPEPTSESESAAGSRSASAHTAPARTAPAQTAPCAPDLRSRVTYDANGSTLVLGIVGTAGPDAQARLDADTSLLALLLDGETELDMLADELVTRQDQLLAIFEISRLIRHSSDIHATLRTLTAHTRQLLKASQAFVRLEQPGQPPLTVMEPTPFADDTLVIGWLDRVRDTSQECLVRESFDPSRQPHVLAVPVRAGMQVAGVLGVTRTERSFQAPDSKLMLAIVEQAAALIENALVQRERVAEAALRAEMDLAARVQRDLLSRTWPTRRGLDLFATARPASQVGGDFYDVMGLGEDGLFVCLGDVSGKGVPAALVMAMTRAVLRHAVRTSPPEPHWLLRTAAGSLYEDLTALEMFATMFLGMFDARTRELRYINAGHAPVIHRAAANSMSLLLTPDEPPLGMLPTTERRSDHRLQLDPGDLLVIASDGINESRSPGDELFGYRRVMETIDRAAQGSAADIAQELLAGVEQFRRGRPPGDDQTIMVLKGL